MRLHPVKCCDVILAKGWGKSISCRLQKIEDIEVVLTNEEGCTQYDLPTDRMGDIICMSSKNSTIGSAEKAHDLSKLK